MLKHEKYCKGENLAEIHGNGERRKMLQNKGNLAKTLNVKTEILLKKGK